MHHQMHENVMQHDAVVMLRTSGPHKEGVRARPAARLTQQNRFQNPTLRDCTGMHCGTNLAMHRAKAAWCPAAPVAKGLEASDRTWQPACTAVNNETITSPSRPRAEAPVVPQDMAWSDDRSALEPVPNCGWHIGQQAAHHAHRLHCEPPSRDCRISAKHGLAPKLWTWMPNVCNVFVNLVVMCRNQF